MRAARRETQSSPPSESRAAGISQETCPPNSELNSPYAVAVDSNGNLYIADYENYRIRKVSGGAMTTEQRREIFSKAVHTKGGIEPATLFAQQKVDAAVAWDPDMSDAVTKRAGSKKMYAHTGTKAPTR